MPTATDQRLAEELQRLHGLSDTHAGLLVCLSYATRNAVALHGVRAWLNKRGDGATDRELLQIAEHSDLVDVDQTASYPKLQLTDAGVRALERATTQALVGGPDEEQDPDPGPTDDDPVEDNDGGPHSLADDSIDPEAGTPADGDDEPTATANTAPQPSNDADDDAADDDEGELAWANPEAHADAICHRGNARAIRDALTPVDDVAVVRYVERREQERSKPREMVLAACRRAYKRLGVDDDAFEQAAADEQTPAAPEPEKVPGPRREEDLSAAIESVDRQLREGETVLDLVGARTVEQAFAYRDLAARAKDALGDQHDDAGTLHGDLVEALLQLDKATDREQALLQERADGLVVARAGWQVGKQQTTLDEARARSQPYEVSMLLAGSPEGPTPNLPPLPHRAAVDDDTPASFADRVACASALLDGADSLAELQDAGHALLDLVESLGVVPEAMQQLDDARAEARRWHRRALYAERALDEARIQLDRAEHLIRNEEA